MNNFAKGVGIVCGVLGTVYLAAKIVNIIEGYRFAKKVDLIATEALRAYANGNHAEENEETISNKQEEGATA